MKPFKLYRKKSNGVFQLLALIDNHLFHLPLTAIISVIENLSRYLNLKAFNRHISAS